MFIQILMFLSAFSAMAGHKKIRPAFDRLELAQLVKNYNHEEGEDVYQLVESGSEQAINEAYSKNPYKFSCFYVAYQLLRCWRLGPELLAALSAPDREAQLSQSLNSLFNALNHTSSFHIKKMYESLGDNIIEYDEYLAIAAVKKIIEDDKEKDPKQDPRLGHSYLFFKSLPFINLLEQAVSKMDEKLSDDDIVIGIGNTPQFLLEAYRYSGSRKIKEIKIALSGWPGRIKSTPNGLFRNILTSQGIENFKRYVERLGLVPEEIEGKRVVFLDIINGGQGIEFLIELILDNFPDHRSLPDFYVMSINEQPLSLPLGSITIDNLSLDMNELAKLLDGIQQDDTFLRSMPDFPPVEWDEWPKEPVYPAGEGAKEIIDYIRQETRRAR